MGDAFRGLTIKIGADSRPLNSALNSIKSSAAGAQSQLRAMDKALKFNSGDVKALSSRIDLVGDKALLAARSARTIQDALRQASAETLKFSERSGLGQRNLAEMAADTRQVYAATQQLRSEYTRTNAELQQIYDAAKKAAVASDKYGKITSFEKANKFVNGLRNNLDAVGEKGKKAKAILESLVRSAASRSDTGLAQAFNMEPGLPAASKMVRILHELRAASAGLGNDLEMMNKVEGFRAMRTQLIAYEAELRQAAMEAARFKAELYAAGGGTAGMSKAIADARSMDSALGKATAAAKKASSAFDAMPKSLEAAKAKVAAFKAEEDSLNQKLKATQAVMKSIAGTDGFDRKSALSKNVWAEAEKAVSEYAKLETKIRRVESALNSMYKVDAAHRNGTDVLGAAEYDKLTAKIKKAENALASMKAEMIGVDERVKSTQLEEQFREAYVEVQRLNAELAKLSQRTSALSRLGAAGQAFRQFGYGLYSTITPAIMMAGRYAINAANDIDSAYRDMRKTVNGTEEEFEHLRDAALEFSTTHVTSADTILEIEAMGGQLGIAASNLEGFSEVISSLDIATDIESEDLAKYVGQLSNIMNDIKVHKDDPIEYQKAITSFSDSLVRLGNNSAAQESSIMKVMMRIASLGNISGFTTPQLLAISTAVAATGQGCEAAGTAISKTFSNIESAVGAGGDKLQAFADVAGMSAQEFASAWEGDPVTAFTAFIEGLKRIDTEGGSVDNTLKSLGINSVRQKQALEGLTNTLDVLHDSLGMSQDAWDGMSTAMSDGSIEKAGDAAREAQRKSEGFSGQLQMMKNAAQLLSNELAQGATPIISSLGDQFRNLAQWVKNLPDGFKTTLVGAAGLLAVLGPLSVGFGTLMSAFGNIRNVANGAQGAFVGLAAKINPLAANSRRAAAALSGLQKGLNFLGSWKGMAAVAGIVTAFNWVSSAIQETIQQQENFYKATEGLREATVYGTQNFGSMGDSLIDSGAKARHAAVDYDALVESQARLTDVINERNAAGQADVNRLEDARRTIDRLANGHASLGEQYDLSAAEQGKFIAAIQTVNELCGTQFSVLDAVKGKFADETGAIQGTCAAIDEYIQKKQQQIKQDVLQNNYADTYEQHQQNIKAQAAAVAKLAEAQDNLNDVDTETNRDAVRQAEADLAAAIELTKQSGDALKYYENAIADAQASAEKSTRTFANLMSSSPELIAAFDGVFGDASKAKLSEFSSALDGVGVSVDEFDKLTAADMVKIASTFNQTGDIVESLKAVGIEVKSFGEIFTEDLAKAGMDFGEMAKKVGADADNLAAQFNKAGVSAQDLSRIGSENFALLAEACGNDSGKIVAAISAINALGLDPKEMSVHDNVVEIQGHVIDLNNMTIDGKEFKITETGAADVKQKTEDVKSTAEEVNGEDVTLEYDTEGDEQVLETNEKILETASEAGNTDVTITYHSNIDEARGEMDDLRGYSFDPKTIEIDPDSESAKSELDDLNGYDFDSKSINVYVTGGALATLTAISMAVWTLPSYREIEVRTIHTEEHHASGGILTAGAIRAIPRHADGGINGIVTRATLTNVGLVGEAGDEALIHMRNAGGAIIPLSNRQHVRPFAQAVAAEMTGFGQSQKAGDTYNITVNASGNGDDIARSVTRAIRAQNLMKGRR